MLNQFVIVGRLVKDSELRETETGKKITNITLAVPRSYKNSNGEYDTDFINCILWEGIAQNTTEYCKKGDLIGVKGRIQSRTVEKDEKTNYLTEMVAEKVTFLSSKKEEKAEE
ncbi:MAG: single-stranded DNA-binding protein [Mollicutes bacterium]|nr:single-stranded DNA-binding protein [Mollicutes bacterium]